MPNSRHIIFNKVNIYKNNKQFLILYTHKASIFTLYQVALKKKKTLHFAHISRTKSLINTLVKEHCTEFTFTIVTSHDDEEIFFPLTSRLTENTFNGIRCSASIIVGVKRRKRRRPDVFHPRETKENIFLVLFFSCMVHAFISLLIMHKRRYFVPCCSRCGILVDPV